MSIKCLALFAAVVSVPSVQSARLNDVDELSDPFVDISTMPSLHLRKARSRPMSGNTSEAKSGKGALIAACIGTTQGAAKIVEEDVWNPSLTGSQYKIEIESGGCMREAWLYVPKIALEKQNVPVIFSFHPMLLDPVRDTYFNPYFAGAWQDHTGLRKKADQEGFITVTPRGLVKGYIVAALTPWHTLTGDSLSGTFRGPIKGATWNAGGCCPGATTEKVDDVQYVTDLVAYVKGSAVSQKAQVSVDPRRIYATGGSNGGMLVYRMACEAPSLFAAIAPAASILAYKDLKRPWRHIAPNYNAHPFTCTCPRNPVPTFAANGLVDPFIPVRGLPILNFPSHDQHTELWRRLNGIHGGKGSGKQGNGRGRMSCTSWGTAAQNFTFCTGKMTTHWWPTRVKDGLEFTDEIWKFFQRYTLPGTAEQTVNDCKMS